MPKRKARPTPKLIFSTAPFFRRPVREAFRHAAEAGFESVEVMVTGDPYTQEAHLLAPMAKEFGLGIEAIHAPFLLITRRVYHLEEYITVCHLESMNKMIVFMAEQEISKVTNAYFFE